MSQRGARYIILLSRSGPQSTAAQTLVDELRGAGVTVRTPRCDVSCSESLAEALKQCADLPPIKGCLQCTMVLQVRSQRVICRRGYSMLTQLTGLPVRVDDLGPVVDFDSIKGAEHVEPSCATPTRPFLLRNAVLCRCYRGIHGTVELRSWKHVPRWTSGSPAGTWREGNVDRSRMDG